MQDIQKLISPLVKEMFPSFYQEEGENFIAFVEAYYEWLENNFQVLVLTDTTGFNVGDTITQGLTTGRIIANEGVGEDSILVHVNEFDTFRCFDVNTELESVTSSSGATTYIIHGGKGKRVSPLYWGRRLFELRDVDRTVDLFILNFKEKYLKNIEFDTYTNKQLLVKNSLDLYRSKGTERSIDLFFRLIYGVKAEVYYPGDDLFRLSAAEYYKPQYIEITASEKTVGLVGKQISGVASGATAFVERYIKRRVKNSFVHILYVTNIRGTFENEEVLYSTTIQEDLPKVIGSLSSVTITGGSREFEIGDLVTFSTTRGDYGIARVAEISNETGQVDFIFVDGGFGYTDSANASYTVDDLSKRTQSIVSEKVLVLSNVTTSNYLSSVSVSAGGTGYNNTDIITFNTHFIDATATPVTNSTGGIVSVTVDTPGSGFYSATPSNVAVTNATGGATTGTGATLVGTTKRHSEYFKYFENVTLVKKDVVYTSAVNNQLFTAGSNVIIGNSSTNVAFGVVIENANGALADANGTLTIGVSNNGSFGVGNTIYLASNIAITANATTVTDTSSSGFVMGTPNQANVTVSTINGTFEIGDEVYQLDESGVECGNGSVISFRLSGSTGTLELNPVDGVIHNGVSLLTRNKPTVNANVSRVSLSVGLYDINGSFTNTSAPQIFSNTTGTTGNVSLLSQGSGASFRVGTLTETETVYMNTDLLGGNNQSNVPYIEIALNASTYGFPKDPTANSGDVILSCLNFDSFIIGTIGTLTNINPGTDYNIDPYVLAYQPYISGFDYHDYIIEIENVSGSFSLDERILQTNTSLTTTSIVVANDAGIEVGMKLVQGSANGLVIEVTNAANTVMLRDVQGTFAVNATPVTSVSNGSISTLITSATVSSITFTAKGIVKSSNDTHLEVKRIQFANHWSPGLQIVGQSSGATANIVSIEEDFTTLPIGLNAVIDANVVTANGTVTNLEIIDSGLGYVNNQEIVFLSEDGERAGTAIANVSGTGTGSGYYRTSKGFLSSTSKLQDGDFYQEYSYEVLSRIPLEQYSDMFKKVMHTAGTRFFGGVLIESVSSSNVQYSNSSIEIS